MQWRIQGGHALTTCDRFFVLQIMGQIGQISGCVNVKKRSATGVNLLIRGSVCGPLLGALPLDPAVGSIPPTPFLPSAHMDIGGPYSADLVVWPRCVT